MTAPGIGWAATVAVLALVGLWALIAPGSLVAASRKTARQIRLPYARWLDKTLYVDRIIYRFHRGAGLAIFLGACGILYAVLFGPAAAGAWDGWLGESVAALLVVAGVVGFCFGLVIMLRPSAIKPLEAWGNRWVDLPEERLNRPVKRLPVEAWVAGHTRLFGALVLAGTGLIGLLAFYT